MLLKKNYRIIVFFIFCIVLFILKLIISKYISPVVKITYEFDFQEFLIFTFSFSVFVYLIKFVVIYGLIKTSLFVFDVSSKNSLFSIIIIAELFKILIINGLKIYTFYSLNSEMTLEQFKTIESSYNFYEIFKVNLIEFKYLINFINIFDIIYIFIVLLLFSIYENYGIRKCLKILFLPYALALFLLALVKTFMSL